jgi:hypothetical protein
MLWEGLGCAMPFKKRTLLCNENGETLEHVSFDYSISQWQVPLLNPIDIVLGGVEQSNQSIEPIL